jgi:zinc transporter, ZIP family
METIVNFFTEIGPVWAALIATTFTWLVTALGASLVFFFKTLDRGVLDPMLGFTGY